MTIRKALKLASILLACQALFGCGAPTTASPASAPSPLTGNWNLIGGPVPFGSSGTSLSLALIVNGDQIVAKGNAFVECPNMLGGGGGTVGFTGQIAADGTFQLTEASGNSFLFAITGTVPPSGSSTWNGTYTLTNNPAYSGCTINQTATFTASSFSPLNGTYVGTLTSGPSAAPTGSVGVGIAVSQGTAIWLQSPAPSYLPLSGTVTVTGSPCFTHGTSITVPGADLVEGDHSVLTFSMDDGSQVILLGYSSSLNRSSLVDILLSVQGGQCTQTVYGGTLTRQ